MFGRKKLEQQIEKLEHRINELERCVGLDANSDGSLRPVVFNPEFRVNEVVARLAEKTGLKGEHAKPKRLT